MSLADNWRVEDALMEEYMKKNLVEETPIEEVIETPEEEPILDPDEIISEDFGVICKQDGKVIAYDFLEDKDAPEDKAKRYYKAMLTS